MNYLLDEGVVASKGANTVISLLHHFLDHHTLGEKSVHLHADNCSGQNKNNYVVQVINRKDNKSIYNKWCLLFCVVPDVASPDRSQPVCHTVIYDGGTHQICSRLVLWVVEEEV